MKAIAAFDVSQEATDKSIWPIRQRFDLEEELIIGMSPTNYHMFIVCGSTEFHPRFSFHPCKVVRARKETIRAGVFVRIKGLKKEELEKFQGFLNQVAHSGLRTPSCHMGVLMALKLGLSIEFLQTGFKKLRPQQFLPTLFREGIGRNGEKLQVEIFLVKAKSLEQMGQEVTHFEKYFRWFYLLSDFVYMLYRWFSPRQLLMARL